MSGVIEEKVTQRDPAPNEGLDQSIYANNAMPMHLSLQLSTCHG